MFRNRLLLVSGILCAALGAGSMFPAIVGWLGRGAWQQGEFAAVTAGMILILAGLCILGGEFARLRSVSLSIPAPVRAVMAANVLFLAFCALEATDGLVYHSGRIVYWTSILFLPALAVLYGQVSAQPWAWWVARALAALSTLWFVVFIAIIPFADLRAEGVPTPWYGRLYMAGVTLIFASISAYAFHSLGCREARRYFGLDSADPLTATTSACKQAD